MRPTANPQSAFRAPLNEIMGTEANVRVLRVLAQQNTTLSASELSRRAQLQRSTVSRTLKRLEESGVVQFVGAAPQAQVSLRDGPLGRAIGHLFAAERTRFDALLDGLKRAAASTTPPPISVWIGGRVSLGTDRAGEPIPVYVLDKPDRVAIIAQLIRAQLERLERKLDVTFDVHEFTLADLHTTDIPSHELANAIVVLGVPPNGLQEMRQVSRRIKSHGHHDARGLARGKQIAAAIRKDPSIVERARNYVDKRWRDASPGERKELDEWRRILRTASPASLRKILIGTDERSTRLRQTLPFLGVLDSK